MARKPKTISEESTLQAEAISPALAALVVDENAYLRSRCGGALRQAREAQNLSVQDVASKLRLGPKQIEAMEADHFAKLPEPTIVRGFIRNYAKLLKINAEPLLDAYTVIVPINTQHQLTVKPSSNMQVTSGEKPKTGSYIWAGVLALLALGAWLFYQNFIEKPNPSKPSENIESLSNEAVEPLPQPALPAAERAPQDTTTMQPSTELVLPPAGSATLPTDAAQVPLTVLPVAPVDLNAPATAPVSGLPITALPVFTAPSQLELAATPTGMAKLEFNANQETWVSVIDAEGKKVYDKIIFAGSRESIEAKTPVNITVGNAGGASLMMNGKAIDLAPHSRNNVARIKLE